MLSQKLDIGGHRGAHHMRIGLVPGHLCRCHDDNTTQYRWQRVHRTEFLGNLITITVIFMVPKTTFHIHQCSIFYES